MIMIGGAREIELLTGRESLATKAHRVSVVHQAGMIVDLSMIQEDHGQWLRDTTLASANGNIDGLKAFSEATVDDEQAKRFKVNLAHILLKNGWSLSETVGFETSGDPAAAQKIISYFNILGLPFSGISQTDIPELFEQIGQQMIQATLGQK